MENLLIDFDPEKGITSVTCNDEIIKTFGLNQVAAAFEYIKNESFMGNHITIEPHAIPNVIGVNAWHNSAAGDYKKLESIVNEIIDDHNDGYTLGDIIRGELNAPLHDIDQAISFYEILVRKLIGFIEVCNDLKIQEKEKKRANMNYNDDSLVRLEFVKNNVIMNFRIYEFDADNQDLIDAYFTDDDDIQNFKRTPYAAVYKFNAPNATGSGSFIKDLSIDYYANYGDALEDLFEAYKNHS